MFDDNITTQPAPPSNLPTEPDDMFAGVDKEAPQNSQNNQGGAVLPDALSAGLLRKKESATESPASMTPIQDGYAMKPPVLGKVILLIVVVAAAAGLGYGGWLAYDKFWRNEPAPAKNVATPSEQKVQEALPSEELPVAAESAPIETAAPAMSEEPSAVATTTEAPANMANDKILFGEPVDSDEDGLDDIRERDLGTDINKSDSDGDGLTDADEVIIWKTDPLNPDSDGDTYVDGEEVRNGYNPQGPGKLFNAVK